MLQIQLLYTLSVFVKIVAVFNSYHASGLFL